MSTNTPIEPGLHPKYIRSEQLGKEITELCGLIYAATYQLLVKIREFDDAELWGLPGICSCAHWLNWKCGIGISAAREKVRVARALADLPLTSAAFSKGELSYSKVRAITRVGTADNEKFLLNIARHGTASHLETVVRGYRRARQLNETDSARSQFDQRSVTYFWDDDGCLVIRGRLPVETGALVVKALEASAQTVRDNVSAETLRPFAEIRADALAGLCESYLEHGAQNSSSADRYQVMLHVSAETLAADVSSEISADTSKPRQAAGRLSSEPATAHVEHGPHVSAETCRRICCDTAIRTLIENQKGQAISIGRKSRLIPPPMRQALKARDRGCRFPGCTHRHFIDGHHIRHWADGGETRLDNLIQLCRFHHRLVHEQGFGCEKGADGKILFTSPQGWELPETGWEPPLRRGPVIPDLKERLEDLHIHSQTCVPRWAGETMDRGLAVELLWAQDSREH